MTTPLFSLAIFVPSLIAGLGYTGVKAQLMGVPTFLSAVPFVIAVAYYSDKWKKRGLFAVVLFAVALIGWILVRIFDKLVQCDQPLANDRLLQLATCSSVHIRYAATFIVSIGSWPISAPMGTVTISSEACPPH